MHTLAKKNILRDVGRPQHVKVMKQVKSMKLARDTGWSLYKRVKTCAFITFDCLFVFVWFVCCFLWLFVCLLHLFICLQICLLCKELLLELWSWPWDLSFGWPDDQNSQLLTTSCFRDSLCNNANKIGASFLLLVLYLVNSSDQSFLL